MYKTKPLTLKPGVPTLNRTFKYLLPALKLFDTQLVDKTKYLPIISTVLWNEEYKSFDVDDSITIILDIKGRKKEGEYVDISKYKFRCASYLSFIRNHPSYVEDYPIGNSKSSLHAVILKLPDRCEGIRDRFIKGNYSELYTPSEVNLCFKEVIDLKVRNPLKRILLKDPTYYSIFRNQVKKDFGTILDVEYDNRELDYPPQLREEVLNYNINNLE